LTNQTLTTRIQIANQRSRSIFLNVSPVSQQVCAPHLYFHSCLGKRYAKPSGKEEKIDQTFWGSEEHRTWEESESDSDVSYDLDEEDEEEEELESEMEGDEDEDEEREEEEEEDEQENRRKRPRFQAYKPPPDKDIVRKKTVVVRKSKPAVSETPKSVADSVSAPIERRQTRESTQARTQEVMEKPAATGAPKRKPSTPSRSQSLKPTQEQLMEEAKIVEEWNKADYDAYIRFTELSEKERQAFLQKKKPKGLKNAYTIVSRSFIKDGEVASEIRVIEPVKQEPVGPKKKKKPGEFDSHFRSIYDILGIQADIPMQPDKSYKYRFPYGSMPGYNTLEEFRAIRDSGSF